MHLPPPPGNPDRPDARVLLWAYAHGIFPMADPDHGTIDWYCPDPRGLLPLDERFQVTDSLLRVVRSGRFDVRTDVDFEGVMRACAAPRAEDDDTWIDETLIGAYVQLHRLGYAHSVEAWREGLLVGGLYGVALGGAFFGESMFIRPEVGGTNASKVCLVHLVERLRDRGYVLLDTQFYTDHLGTFGCFEVSREAYLEALAEALAVDVEPW